MLYLKLLTFVAISALLSSCKTASISKTEISSQSRSYTSFFYDEVFPLLEGTINFRRTKFHGQTKEIYINIDELNKTITLKEPIHSSVLTHIFDSVERNPKLLYSEVKSAIKLRIVYVKGDDFDSFKNLIDRIKRNVLDDIQSKNKNNYRIEVVADGESFKYSYEKPEGYVISLRNNSDSDVVESFLMLRAKLLKFD